MRQAIECVDVCVRFSRLPIEYYNAIGDHIGRTVRVDRKTVLKDINSMKKLYLFFI